jgi:nickel/cobalt exporter
MPMTWGQILLKRLLSTVTKDVTLTPSFDREISMKSGTSSVQTKMNTAIFWRLTLLGAVVGLGILIYSQWGAFAVLVIDWQKTLHTMLASHISGVSDDALKHGSSLIALSFAYGVFHAVGPGHGKAVIITYLGTNRESLLKGVSISLCAAILQSLIAIVLVSALASMLKFRLSEVQNYGNDIALVSYALIVLLGAMLVVSSISRLLKLQRSKLPSSEHEYSGHSHRHDHSENQDQAHSNAAGCGCTHAYVAEENQSIWQTITVILSMGFRPCSGAIIVLIYAHLVGFYTYGVIATLMMGLGTGLAVSLIAIGTLYARSWLDRFVSELGDASAHTHLSISHYVRFIGGAILVALGWSFYDAASTFNMVHPLF